MSTKYKHGDTVPTAELCNRLDELARAVAGGPDSVRREFDMRIPAERDRDADLVLYEAATRLRSLEARSIQTRPAVQRDVSALVEALEHGFPLLSDEGLDEVEHHCEWVIQRERKRVHSILAAHRKQGGK